MAEKRQMLPDHPTVTDLYAVIGELQDQLASMHEECDEHEENDGDIIMELRAENERLRAAAAKHHTAGEEVMPGVLRCYVCGETWQT